MHKSFGRFNSNIVVVLLNTLFSSKRYEVNDVSNVVALDNGAPFYFHRSNATLKALKIVFLHETG